MPIATAPALLIGLGARIVLDYFSRSEGPFIKDFILAGAWQGVALHYAARTSKTSGFGIIVAFAIAAKLFIEFNIVSDVTRCVASILGVALGVLFTDFLSQYFDKPAQTSERRRKKAQTPKSERKRDKVVQFLPSAQGGSVETITDLGTSLGTTSLATSHRFSDMTSVDSNSEKLGPISSLSPLEREVHVLRTRAALADSERRRFKEERRWAISQGNEARASQMKWEVKRYTSLMETFTREADLKELELKASNGNGRQQPHIETPPSSSSKDKYMKNTREVVNGNIPSSSDQLAQRTSYKRASNSKAREANG
ncbi:hypothetical protein BDN70DRAFT_875446 [Pholiota conissans]|uniref:Uncharacterized protein n=1 Tax=Pholiota conissans TaxID=109636 RepID=A0A9P5Z658_9AGAR|nr:hypothetical protein BDN70DRAFT_875446 [Pholiota conissans]